ncbi:glutamate decarboxylase gad1 [Penicillium rubens]|nr:glutamate decarboxylase gad1 [Penicillium rubens]
MESIKFPSILDPPDNPAPARGNIRTQKPKQTKSRNGCITCKAKRLKCDEIKPSCHQCERRKVQCGGYKKDFKWRPFEETNLASGRPTVTKAKKANNPSQQAPSVADIGQTFPTPPTTEQSASPIRMQSHKFDGSRSPPGSPLHGSPTSINSFLSTEARSLDDLPVIKDDVSMADCTEPPLDVNVSLSADSPPFNFLSFLEPFQDSLSLANSLVSDVDADRARHMPFGPDQPAVDASKLSFSQLLEDENDDIEEIIRKSDPGLGPWNFTIPQGDYFHLNPPRMSENPSLPPESPEMLVLRFDKLTCGILSIKDGALENPWRTLVWPLAKDTPVLRHAIFALAAFHSGKQNPHLRLQGVKHMRQSITGLVGQIQNMRPDAALATSLALAFADTWDQHTRTCIQHLRGAKTLMCQVIASGTRGGASDEHLDRIRFLYNTWSYMDVIARLTSLDDCGPQNWDSSIFDLPSDTVHDIDPLMGCATTLYPLMSRVAKLIQQVRKSSSNTVSVVAQAMELKSLVEQWEPPRWFEPPDDPSSEVQHSIQVAHAYRWATLLYLHQAVPEIPSEPADELAKRVLILLATVPYTSRTSIIQMFPLLAAGSEVDTDDDRKWVLDRWTTIQSRLMLGGVDRCLEVLKEVWERRDAMNAKREREMVSSRRSESFSSGDREKVSSSLPADFRKYSPSGSHKGSTGGRSGQPSSGSVRRGSALASLENIEFERTVRGRLHWVNVMGEWGWEVFIG